MAAQFEGLTQDTADYAAMNLIGVLASARTGALIYEATEGAAQSFTGLGADREIIADYPVRPLPREAFAGRPETIFDYEARLGEERLRELRAPLKEMLIIDMHQPYEKPALMDYEAGSYVAGSPYGHWQRVGRVVRYDDLPPSKLNFTEYPIRLRDYTPSQGEPVAEQPAAQEQQEPEQQGEANG